MILLTNKYTTTQITNRTTDANAIHKQRLQQEQDSIMSVI